MERALPRDGISEALLPGIRIRTAAGTEGIAAARDERISQKAHEQVHRIERGLLRAGGDFAGDLRQPAGRQRAEHQRNAAGGVEEVDQRIGDVLLID